MPNDEFESKKRELEREFENFFNILNNLSDINFGSRKVKHTKIDIHIIDTCFVYDNLKFPYETAIISPYFNDNKCIIVEEYRTENSAVKGHDKWVSKFSDGQCPEVLYDISTCILSKLAGKSAIPYKRKVGEKDENIRRD